MQTCQLRFNLSSTNEPLTAVVRFDGVEIFNSSVDQNSALIQHEFDDDIESSHRLEIELRDKLPSHTQVDANGTILKDSLLQVSGVQLDEIELNHVFFFRCSYRHDHNGHAKIDESKFWGDMGCNGVVTFEFASPVYLWLLEKM